jgi:hypothetical protein
MIHSKKAISGFLLLSGIFLGACKSEQVSNIPTVTQPSANTPIKLEFENVSSVKVTTGKNGEKLDIKIDYVQAKGEHPIAQKFNQMILDTLKNRLNDYAGESSNMDLSKLSLDSCVSIAQKNYQKIIAEMDEAESNNWSIELTATISKNTEKLICVALGAYTYTGGAHPNTYVEYLNFSTLTQKNLSKAELIADENGLKTVAEVAFRKHWAGELKDLKPEQPLSDAGFEFKDRFDLPEQIGFQGDSLVLFYNTYEISAYVTGSTDLYLPLSEVSKFLK